MRYAFTGPSKLTAIEVDHARVIVAGLDEPTEITTGAADGWDTAVCLAALELWPRAQHRIICPGAAYNVGLLVLVGARAQEHRVESVTVTSLPPEGKASYRIRNEQLVDHADVLVAAVRSTSFYRSGEWMTANIAKRRAVPIQWVDLLAIR